jgi:hypothetical protein
MKGFAGARGRYSTVFPVVYGATDDGSNFGTIIPSGYPTFPPDGIAGSSEVYLSLLASNSSALGNPANQIRLRCVIKQNGQFYYVWNIAYT